MNLTLALAETPREITIDSTVYVLVRKAALDALYPGSTGDRAPRSPAARAASPVSSRLAPKKSKARSPKPAARPAAVPKPEAQLSKPESGALRNAVLAEIERCPGSTSLELFERISEKIPTTSGSVYTAVKAWVAKGFVSGKPTDAGPKGWFPTRSARKPASGNRTTLDGPALHPNAPASHPAPSGPAEARGAA
jgi:hypothetical protein